MKAYLIDPFTQTVSEVEYSGNYQDIYEFIDCDTFTCVDINEDGDTVFVDDEGLINGKPQEFFAIRNYPQPLAGKGLVLGTDEEGESVSPVSSIEDIRSKIEWIPSHAILDYIN